METHNNESCDKLMEKYNFDSPIKVIVVIEEEDPPDPLSLRGLLLSNNTDDPKRNVCTNRTEVSKKTQDMPWYLLDIVAENLIHITKSYYYNFINNPNQVTDIDKSKCEFLKFKHYFFNLSYSTTLTILLPQENNTQFIRNFIHRVIEIANRNFWYVISYTKLEILIRDMLIWVKEKKKFLDNKFGSNNYESMNNQPEIVHKPYFPLQVMNVAPNINDRTNNLTQGITSPLKNPFSGQRRNDLMQTTANPTTSTYIKKISAQKRKKCPKTFKSQQKKNLSPNPVQRTNHSHQGTSSSFNIDHRANNLLPEITHSPYFGSNINHSEAEQKIVISAGPPNQEFTISVNPQILANFNNNKNQINNNATESNVNETYGTESIKRRKTNDDQYINSNSMAHHQNSYSQKNNCSATTFKPHIDGIYHGDSIKTNCELNTDTLRSSISRDSGLGSPVYSCSRNEEMIEPLTRDTEPQTPVISHVTSLNPKAVNLIHEFCAVCGATTNNVCIECFQQYYCSSLCQDKDWDVHKYQCGATKVLL